MTELLIHYIDGTPVSACYKNEITLLERINVGKNKYGYLGALDDGTQIMIGAIKTNIAVFDQESNTAKFYKADMSATPIMEFTPCVLKH